MKRSLVVAGGLVLDGLGGPARALDVRLEGERIAALEPHSDFHAGAEVLDASGLHVAPGFIDVHSHADNAPFLAEPDLTKLLQGVTTEVVGNCGLALAPRRARFPLSLQLTPAVEWEGESFAELLAAADRHGYVTSYAPLAAHGTIRNAVLGMEARRASAAELAEMGSLLEECVEAGAFGVSSGLIYPPGVYSTTEELVELCRHLPPGGLYATHMRGEGDTLEESVAEAIRIGEEAGCRVQVSHHKATGRRNWGKTERTLRMLAEARGRGLEVDQDVYPYLAGSTVLTACLPPSFMAGGEEAALERLRSDAGVAELGRAIESGLPGWENMVGSCGWDGILVGSTEDHRFEGRTLAELSAELGLPPLQALVHVLLEERLRASMIAFAMAEPDLRRVLTDPHTMIGSDGLPPGTGGKPHPRLYGTFPRVLARYVREEAVLPLPEAVRRMTSLPAWKFRIPERGRIEPGLVADLVAFDASRVTDVGDYRDPVHHPEGIAWVMQAGRLAARDGRFLGSRLGRRLLPAG